MAAVLPSLNTNNLEKIESFLNDPAYKELLENSANYNTRLCIERRLRLPFLDSQTGVAQNHSQLYMNKRQRMPGMMQGQIYTYPRPRWRKKRRQYLTSHSRSFARTADALLDADLDMHNISQVENPAVQDTDSKDSQLLKDDVKEWFYDEQDMLDMDTYDEPDQDSDVDYEEYSKRPKRKKTPGRNRGTESPGTPGRRKGSTRGRKKSSVHNYDPNSGDPDKPFACELCGARYKTRPGLTYHYGHSHKEGASDENSRDSNTSLSQVSGPPPPGGASGGGGGPTTANVAPPPPPPILVGGPTGGLVGDGVSTPGQQGQGHVYQDSYVSFLNHPAGTAARRGRQPIAASPQQPVPPPPPPHIPPTLPPNLPTQMPPVGDDPPMPILVPEKNLMDPRCSMSSGVEPMMGAPPPTVKDGKAMPSPYCDFCLGDASENKKTGGSEELVSCSDCGRSGHPSCLQFTANMIISVKKYRWQCIECKCCSVCGNSDNDDQLLFCDDCDRGYHMYCLSPPLNTPPEGSWSCKLCNEQFHL